jgi:phosphoglycolate phosphatase-like HAD superfamily hydrolase
VDSKKQIITFVESVTDSANPMYISKEERIATFDNDGTLWCEQPLYFQLYFTIDRIKQMYPDYPEWDTLMPYSAIIHNDMQSLLSTGELGLLELVMTTHANTNTEEFEFLVKAWADTAIHPTLNKHFSDLVYQPMLELLQYLQENHFKTYVVSGGGVDFMRPIISDIYSIPPEQIIGSIIQTSYSYTNGKPQITRMPSIYFINDKEGKPENIQRIIGRKPVLSVGNSDGDLNMLQWTGSRPTYLNIIVHHTDEVREWAYDKNSHIGKLDQGLIQATEEKWTVVDMKNDWKIIFPYQL